MFREACMALLIFFFVSVAFGQVDSNPGTISQLDGRIRISGTIHSTGLGSAVINIRLPQTEISNLRTSAPTAFIFKDSMGNKILRMVIRNLREGVTTYSAEFAFSNAAKSTPENLPIKAADSLTDDGKKASYWLQESENVRLTKEIIRRAWPFERSLKHAAELTIEAGRKGEGTSVLAALLRASGIPARIVEGYRQALPGIYQRAAWVEVLASLEGRDFWVPFDPDALQGGWLDATHIPFAYLLDSSQYSLGIEYFGTGSASLIQEDVTITPVAAGRAETVILESAQPPITFPNNLNGLIAVRVKPKGCVLFTLEPLSCLDRHGEPALDIFEQKRPLWSCGEKTEYWLFSTNRSNFICPITIRSPIASEAQARVSINEEGPKKPIAITGPSITRLGDPFTLTATGIEPDRFADAFFFSPEFGRSQQSTWTLSLSRPGIYKFYLLFDGSLAQFAVNAIRQRTLILLVTATTSADFGKNITLRATVQNLLLSPTETIIRIRFGTQVQERTVKLPPLRSVEEDFTFRTESIGTISYIATTSDSAVEVVTGEIEVTAPRTIETVLARPASDFFTAMARLLLRIVGLGF